MNDISKLEMINELKSLRREVAELKKKQIIFDSTEDKSSEFFKHILENIPSDLVVFDVNHKYLYINPIAVKDEEMRAWLTGKTDYDYCKRKNKAISLADGRREVFNKVKESLEGVFYEEMMLDDQGLEVWNLRRMYPITNNKGDLQYVVGYATDITPLKRLEKDLKKAKLKAKASMRIKEEFLANMSHEIRTPMNAILGMSNLLQDVQLDDKNRSYLNGISKSAKNLIVVVNDILDFSKMSSDNLVLEKIPINLQEEILQLKTLFELKSSEKNISLIFDIDSKIDGVNFEGDPVRLNQVLNNLLSNALKFTEQGSVTLSVTVKSQADAKMKLAFSVKDSGIGISDEDQEIIFLPFSQADASTTRKYGGTGLGLSISKRLVRLMGGSLSLFSVEGKGSEFYFELLLSTSKVVVNQEDSFLDVKVSMPNDFKVLLVEDNPMNQLYATSLLEMYTNKIIMANNGQEALDILKIDKSFDLVLMDIQMPVMGGEECTKYIRERLNLKVPIIALTANAFKKDQDSYIKFGMNDCLSKPFEERDLMKMLLKFLH